MVSRWEDVRTFDDIILSNERKMITELESESKRKCPALKKEGNYFYYCGLNLQEIKDKKPSPSNPIYLRCVSVGELSLHCMKDFEACCFYSGKISV